VKVSLADREGNVTEKRLIWAYLDDITLALRPGVTEEDVMGFLKDPDNIGHFGLTINESKCWFMSQADLEKDGHKLLGSWIGGPDDDSSGALGLIEAATDKLVSIIPILKQMPLQHGLLLLRLCYFPILNHLLRTLPLGIGNRHLGIFDNLIWQTVKGWVNDQTISHLAPDIIRLPRRLGGLGFFDSVETRPYAAAASYIQSRGSLLARGMSLGDRVFSMIKPAIERFAADLNMSCDELFAGDFWMENDLQRRGAELNRERAWMEIFFDLDDFNKVRFVEGQSILRRKWIDCLPVLPSLRVSDQEVRYGLQELLLSSFSEATSPSRTCLECSGAMDGPLHHLSCCSTANIRTTRHTAIHNCFESAMKDAGAGGIQHAPYVGLGDDGLSRFADTAATILEVRSHYDYTAITTTYNRTVRIPGEAEILEQIGLDEARGTRNLERFLFWEDHSDEKPHPSTLKIRKLRQIVFQETVGKDLVQADRRKYRHYGAYAIIPVSLSARGSMGRHTVSLVDNLCNNRADWEFTDRVKFRRDLLCHLSVTLLRCASKMKAVRAGLAMEGC
jgi:hypothetical protein